MTFIDYLMVGFGGFLGAIIRYFIALRLNSSERIPIGTLIVNLFGAFLVGFIFGMDLSIVWTFFLALGLGGALTTFSTMNKELIELWRNNYKKEALLYIFFTYCGGILLALLGYYLGSSF